MHAKHWLIAALSLLAAGLLYVHTGAAPAPEPLARGQVGRYTFSVVKVPTTNKRGTEINEAHQALLDTSTGRLWVLVKQEGKGAKLKWEPAAEAPK